MRSPLVLLPLLVALGACNMVISETPMFGKADQSKLLPRDGIWLADVEDCKFDSASKESEWPKCAVWVIARDSGRELVVSDGKGQSQPVVSTFASGTPSIVQGQWTDDAKTPVTTTYGFYGLEARDLDADGRFSAASVWPVECGIQSGAGIQPFPGISADCRPLSKDSIRAAALASRNAAQVSTLRWLRPETR